LDTNMAKVTENTQLDTLGKTQGEDFTKQSDLKGQLGARSLTGDDAEMSASDKSS